MKLDCCTEMKSARRTRFAHVITICAMGKPIAQSEAKNTTYMTWAVGPDPKKDITYKIAYILDKINQA